MTKSDFLEKWCTSLRRALIALDPRDSSTEDRAEVLDEFISDVKSMMRARDKRRAQLRGVRARKGRRKYRGCSRCRNQVCD